MEKITITSDLEKYTFDELSEEDKRGVLMALKASHFAFAPISHFEVGAFALCEDGKEIRYANNESVVQSPGVCAERGLVWTKNNKKYKGIKKIFIIGIGPNGPSEEILTPCGTCRQVLKENEDFFKVKTFVYMASGDLSTIVKAPLSALIPLPFTFSSIGIDISNYKNQS